jgi:hypothetical protein
MKQNMLDLNWKLLSKVPSTLYLHLPIEDGNQKILSLELSKNPEELFKEKYYSYAKYLTDGNFFVSAKIRTETRGIDRYKDANDIRFLTKEPYLLMDKTRKFVKSLSNAREVYEWILKNVGFPKSLKHYLINLTNDDSSDLRMAIKENKSMCGGKSLLFVSMCRNLGIPSRTVTGYFLRNGWAWLKNAKFHKNWLDLHVWAEYYENGWWIPVDCNIAQQTGKDYFGKFPEKTFNHNDRRIAISKGSSFLIDGKVRHSLQTAHFDKGSNLKISLKVK